MLGQGLAGGVVVADGVAVMVTPLLTQGDPERVLRVADLQEGDVGKDRGRGAHRGNPPRPKAGRWQAQEFCACGEAPWSWAS